MNSGKSLAIEVVLACFLPLLAVPAAAWGGPMFPPAVPAAPVVLAPPPCEWAPWSACDMACNGGFQVRSRVHPRHCEFGPFHQIRICNTQPCPQNCVLAEWTEWNCGSGNAGGCCGCSAPCGGGYRSRSRTVLSPALFGGTCGDTIESESCNSHACPYDCVITSAWSAWQGCSVQCGGGTTSRSRGYELVQVTRAGPSETEASCPSYYEERVCNPVPCAIDCVLSGWSLWTGCPNSYSLAFRYRAVDVFPQNGGQDCENSQLETQPCGAQSPPAYPQYPPAQPPQYPPAQPPQYPPAQPPAQPPQYPPAQPPQYPPAQPPRYPPAQPPAQPPQYPPAQPPRYPPAQPPAQPPRYPPAQPQYPPASPPAYPAPASPPAAPARPIPSYIPPPSSSQDPSFCLSRQDGAYPKPDCRCCNEFTMCFQRSPLQKYCPPGDVFVAETSKCASAAAAGCNY